MAKYEWTIMIIAQEDNNNGWEYKDLLKTIRSQKWNEKIRYIIFHYYQPQHKGQVEILEYDMYSGKKISIIANSEKFNIFLDEPSTIEGFINDFVLKEGEDSEHYILITWGHGGGLGFFHYVEEYPGMNDKLFQISLDGLKENKKIHDTIGRSTLIRANLSLPIKESSLKTIFSEISYDELDPMIKNEIMDRHRLLTSEVFGRILNNCFKKIKIDYFIANSCYVQMIDVGLALSRNVEVYVASQTAVPFAGINYAKLFQLISDSVITQRTLSKKEVTDNIINYFIYRYIDGDFGIKFKSQWKDFDLFEVALSAIDLSYAGRFSEIVNEVGSIILKYYGDHAFKTQMLGMARIYCNDYPAGSGFIDFENFLAELVKTFQICRKIVEDLKAGNDRDRLEELLVNLCRLKQTGGLLSFLLPGKLNFTDIVSSDFGKVLPLGFSVFYPDANIIGDIREITKDYYVENYDSEYSNKGSNWAKFVSQLLA